jgi:hypothetical protein
MKYTNTQIHEYTRPRSRENPGRLFSSSQYSYRGFKKDREAKTGANRFEDEGKREQYKRSACDRERARMKDMNKSFEMVSSLLICLIYIIFCCADGISCGVVFSLYLHCIYTVFLHCIYTVFYS